MQNKPTFQIHGGLVFTSYHFCKTNKRTKEICKYKKFIAYIRQKWMPIFFSYAKHLLPLYINKKNKGNLCKSKF
jgi:hypothetical protein